MTHPARHVVNFFDQVRVPRAGGLSVSELVRRVVDMVYADHVGAFARSLAFNVFFALFPTLVFLMSMFALVTGPQGVEELIDLAERSNAIPQATIDFVGPELEKLVTANRRAGLFTLGAIVSFTIALFAVSGAFRSTMEAMNVMYAVRETRPFLRRYVRSMLLSIGTALLLVSALVAVVGGHDIGAALADLVGLGEQFDSVWNSFATPMLGVFVLLAVLFAFALVYHFAPATQHPFKFFTLGAAMAFIAWLGFTLLFSLYLNNFGSLNKTFGALAGGAILMLYAYYSAYIMLLGAEINHVVELAKQNREGSESDSLVTVETL